MARPTQPVIILTAKGDESDRVAGLKNGADDYVVKPFSVRELVARVQAVLRRSPSRPGDLAETGFPGGTIDFERREIRLQDGQRCDLSERESELLRYLAINPGAGHHPRRIAVQCVANQSAGVSTRTIDMHIARIREKLADDPASPKILLTVRGKGYMWGNH